MQKSNKLIIIISTLFIGLIFVVFNNIIILNTSQNEIIISFYDKIAIRIKSEWTINLIIHSKILSELTYYSLSIFCNTKSNHDIGTIRGNSDHKQVNNASKDDLIEKYQLVNSSRSLYINKEYKPIDSQFKR